MLAAALGRRCRALGLAGRAGAMTGAGAVRAAAMSRTPQQQQQPQQQQDDFLVLPVPESRFEAVLDHVTPIFLRDEPLSRCFPPCASGRREAAFRQYALEQLRSGLCVMAVPAAAAAAAGAPPPVVGACLNRVLTRQQIMDSEESEQLAPDEDPLLGNVLRLLKGVHRRLDLFSALGVPRLLEIGLVSVDPGYVGRGLASRVVRASLELGARRGLPAAKADATGSASARACQRAGLCPVYELPYSEYRPGGRAVFAGAGPGAPALRVVAARLQREPPHVLPVELTAPPPPPPPPPQAAP